MKRTWSVASCVVVMAAGVAMSLRAQGGAVPAAEPFKLGTFNIDGRETVGIVLRDTAIVDLAAANRDFEGRPGVTKVLTPGDMKELISRYDSGLSQRVRQIVNALVTESRLAGAGRPAYVRDLKSVKVLPPVMPETILNAAVNYTEHANEMAGRGGAAAAAPTPPPESMPGLWQRKPGDTRHNPYLFLKPRAAVIADGQAIRLPPGRDRIDWECELNAVIGRTASHVPVDRAADHVFGYTLQNDVSDRGGRGDSRHGSDWLIGKGHDTFAPVGPFIVPKEFVPNPQTLAIKFTLSGRLMQDSNTDRMTHTVVELVSFASHILTLKPGDLISTGSPAGVGTARATPIYMKPGDVSVCSIEGIGTLTNPVVGPTPTTSSSR